MNRRLWIVIGLIVVGVFYLWATSRRPLTSEDLIRHAHETCLDLGNSPEVCANTN